MDDGFKRSWGCSHIILYRSVLTNVPMLRLHGYASDSQPHHWLGTLYVRCPIGRLPRGGGGGRPLAVRPAPLEFSVLGLWCLVGCARAESTQAHPEPYDPTVAGAAPSFNLCAFRRSLISDCALVFLFVFWTCLDSLHQGECKVWVGSGSRAEVFFKSSLGWRLPIIEQLGRLKGFGWV